MQKDASYRSFNGSFKYSHSIPTDAAHAFGMLFIVCGIAAFAFNAAILFVLFYRRRSIFSHVFYIMIFNFALIDLLKSLCSIVWALKLLPVGVSSSILFMKIDQLVLMILRFSNLATILNLLMITLNEYLFIVYPLHYRQIVTRCRVIVLLIICWFAAWTFTVSILLIGSREQSIYIKPDCLARRNRSAYLDLQHRLAMLNFMRIGLSRTSMYYARWIFQSLMCLHSLLQPLCYFRMREFRAMFKA
uniref:G-protein coupled receptors family 1 profile domain-containing protein n=1 Tax=Ascaris lumbricoides TaxID=6252 RepID=A0A9J2Q5D6_ASCLU